MKPIRIAIPALCPRPVDDSSIGSYCSSQPIIQFKELEVDRVRWDQWKAILARPERPARRKGAK